jgi:hypothetical protein
MSFVKIDALLITVYLWAQINIFPCFMHFSFALHKFGAEYVRENALSDDESRENRRS